MSTEMKAHGLDGTLVDADWPALTATELEAVLSHYPELSGPVEILTVSPRPLSAASVIAAGTHRVFVKRHARAVRDAEGLQEEHRFMRYLLDHGISVPRVMTDATSNTAVELGDWSYEAHSVPQGRDLYKDAISWTPFHNADHAFEAGKTLASLHRAAAGYDAHSRRRRALVAGFTIFAAADPKSEFDAYLDSRPALRDYVTDYKARDRALILLEPFHRELLPCLPQLPRLWTHNDIHPSNLWWTEQGESERVSAVFDFGLCDRTNAVHDLAHAIERSIIEWLSLTNDPAHPEAVAVHVNHLWALLRGYEAVRPLADCEARALAPMLALCHAEFALSEIDYYLSVLHSEERATVACEGYLLGHAEWWRGCGSELLEGLRSWARERNGRGGNA